MSESDTETPSKGPAVVLVSGGLDSSVLLRHAVRNLSRRPVHALSFNYGQRHSKELECARKQAEGIAAAVHRVIDISFMGGLLMAGSALVQGGAPVPDLKDLAKNDLTQPPTYVPNRNMMLLSIAAAYAEAQGVQDIFYGAQAQDEYGYWDCTEAFLDRINHVLALNRRERVTIHAPFVHMKKSEIVRLGLALGVDFALTWSCYRGGEKACGTCPTCVERLSAFRQAGASDPLPYQARV
jgi:7-cyano-7-deazaguanine synthase